MWSDGLDNEMLFRSGGRAEAAARRLGKHLAAAGEPCEIRIHDRNGDLVGRFACPVPTASPTISGGGVAASAGEGRLS